MLLGEKNNENVEQDPSLDIITIYNTHLIKYHKSRKHFKNTIYLR